MQPFNRMRKLRLKHAFLSNKQALVLLTDERMDEIDFSRVQLCFLGRCNFCVRLFGSRARLPVSDREAALSSETPPAQANMSDASLIRLEAMTSAAPSVRSASEPKATARRASASSWRSFASTNFVISCKFGCICWLPGRFKWVNETPQL